MNEFIPEIMNFWTRNGECNLDPMIRICRTNNKNNHNNNNNSKNNNQFIFVSQSKLISLCRKKSGRYQIVSSYKGIIPQGTIIGQFTGIEYFQDEIEDCQCNPLFFTQNGCIPTVMSFKHFMNDEISLINNINNINNNNTNDNSVGICDLNEISDIIVTPQNDYNYNKIGKFNCLLSQITDCRKIKRILNNEIPHKREQLKCNIAWLYCKINGWPIRFGLTIKNINFNDILYSYNDWNYSKILDCRIKNLEKNDSLIDNIDNMLNRLCLKLNNKEKENKKDKDKDKENECKSKDNNNNNNNEIIIDKQWKCIENVNQIRDKMQLYHESIIEHNFLVNKV